MTFENHSLTHKTARGRRRHTAQHSVAHDSAPPMGSEETDLLVSARAAREDCFQNGGAGEN